MGHVSSLPEVEFEQLRQYLAARCKRKSIGACAFHVKRVRKWTVDIQCFKRTRPYTWSRDVSIDLEDCNSTWRTSNSTFDMQWCTCEEECVAFRTLALLAQLLEVPHLTDGHSPASINL